jgi:alginate O-acetyltransferase complex protein AlgI
MTPFDRMVLGVGVVFLVFKALTFRRLAPARALGYLAFWPGMDPGPFTRTAPVSGIGLIAWGASKMSIGAALLCVRVGIPVMDLVRVFAGIGLLIHFGLFDVLAGCWRRRGIAVERLFVNPAASRTLGEFWGRRWNLAFHVVARDFVFRPSALRWGTAAGILCTFLFSGLIHEALISVPAGGGYGLPTAYFVLQGLLVLVERAGKVGGRVWTLAWVLAPAPLLFHPPFLRAFILPLT